MVDRASGKQTAWIAPSKRIHLHLHVSLAVVNQAVQRIKKSQSLGSVFFGGKNGDRNRVVVH